MSYAGVNSAVESAADSPRLERVLWFAAIVLFGVGDLVTTAYFIIEYGAVETHPIGSLLIEWGGLWMLVPLKVIGIGVFYIVYRIVPKPHSIGAPIGLALLGAFTSTWNTLISTVGIPVL